jgi:PhzF family phenazine biosynthesis protein
LELRWFTPEYEVDLCGHATLASAFVLFTELDPSRDSVVFQTRSGPLGVQRSDDRLIMDFPTWTLKPGDDPPGRLVEGLGAEPAEVLRAQGVDNFFAVFETQSEVAALRPDFGLLEQLHPCGVVATAPGDESDCVSRYFAPSYGIPEDPVTGSIHCGLVPYWAGRLGKPDIYARQISSRGGELFCRHRDKRVEISGHAVKFLEGKIQIPG